MNVTLPLPFPPAGCNRTFNASSGTVSAVGNRVSCFTNFQAPQGSFINLYFSSFYIRNRGQNCTEGNTIKVFDGADSSATVLLSTCGYMTPGPVSSTGNALRLEHTPQQWGSFTLTYTTSTQGGGCGGSLFARKWSSLTSPGYPGPSPTGRDCVYTIAVPPDKHVALMFDTLDFTGPGGCNSTFLEMYDVNLFGHPNLINTLCGHEDVAEHLSPGSRMVLRYVMGGPSGEVTGQGWSVSVNPGMPHESTVFESPEGNASTE
ncbi:cubilin-like [Panulirus ornatus]|uniref:cubilin-like n=1 Tax=Panulirus ornatus TaxID=150431 RepID=UPI003A87FFA8